MSMVECMVVKVREDSILVVSPDGGFRSFPMPSATPRVGERIEVDWPKDETVYAEDAAVLQAPAGRERATWRSGWRLALVASVLLAVLVPTGYGLWQRSQPPVLAAMDINPSLELTLDTAQRVREAMPVNQDASQWWAVQQVSGLDISEALAYLLEQAAEEGYLASDGSGAVLVTLVPLRAGAEVPDAAALQARLRETAQADGIAAYLEVGTAAATDLREARHLRLSLNQYLAWQQARANGAAVTSNDVRGFSVRRILSLVGLTPMQGFPGGALLPAGPGGAGAGGSGQGGQGGQAGQGGPGVPSGQGTQAGAAVQDGQTSQATPGSQGGPGRGVRLQQHEPGTSLGTPGADCPAATPPKEETPCEQPSSGSPQQGGSKGG